MTISRRFVGPPDSGHGGYSCGLVAAPLGDGPVQVTLRRPPPVGRPLELSPEPTHVTLLDGEHLVAEAVPAPPFPDADRPQAVSWEEAEKLAATFDVARCPSHPSLSRWERGPVFSLSHRERPPLDPDFL